MIKIITVLAMLLLAPVLAVAQDIWSPGYVWNQAANAGEEVWFGPGNRVTTDGAFARSANATAAAGGHTITESGSVRLRDGRVVKLSAARYASTAALFASASRVAFSPYGLVAALALPPLYDWITSEGGTNIRVNPGRTGVEVKDPSVCTVSPCAEYQPANQSIWVRSIPNGDSALVSACKMSVSSASKPNPAFVQTYHSVVSPNTCRLSYTWNGVDQGIGNITLVTRNYTPLPPGWLPASMDDIAPYMTPRVPPVGLAKALIDAGGYIDVTPVTITTVAPPPEISPSVQTTTYPKPANIITTVTQIGNPYGLAPNTPTVTSATTGSQPLAKGNTTNSGPAPATPPVTYVDTPTQTVITSTYDPGTDQTTSTTVKSQDGAQNVKSTTNITNITNTTDSSTATTTTTNVTTITNTTTNTLLVPTITDTIQRDDPKSDCEKNPSMIGCAEFGAPPTPDVLERTDHAVSITPVTFASSSACPAPLTFSVRSQSYSVAYTPLCDRLAMLKTLFLALAAVVASYIVITALKV